MKNSRLNSIDFLRGCAAMGVVFFHASVTGKLTELLTIYPLWFRGVAWTMEFAKMGVALFFVISGFCIHLKWSKELAETGQERSLNFVGFWKRRLNRLYPPYVIALTFTMLMVVAAFYIGINVKTIDNYPDPKPIWLVIDYFTHLTMLHGFHPALDQGAGNSVYWTLAREEFLYLLYFPLLAWRSIYGLINGLTGVIVLGLIFTLGMKFFITEDSAWWEIIKTSALALWVQWCLGMVAVEAYYGLIKLPKWCYSGWLVPVFGMLSIVSERHIQLLSPILWGLTFFILLNYCVRRESEGRWSMNFVVRKFSRIGIWSYSLYLVHYPIQIVVGILLELNKIVLNNLWIVLGYILLLIIISSIGGWIFFCLVEKNFLVFAAQGPEESK